MLNILKSKIRFSQIIYMSLSVFCLFTKHSNKQFIKYINNIEITILIVSFLFKPRLK